MKYALALLAFVSTPALAQVPTDEWFFVADTGMSVPAQNVAKLGKSLIPPNGFGVTGGDERYPWGTVLDAINRAGYGSLEREGRLIAAPGNHDIDGCTRTTMADCIHERKGHFAGWLAAHPSTKGRTYYSVEKTNVAFVVLNANKIEKDGVGVGSKQYNWAKAEIQRLDKLYPFVGVVAHHPAYSSRGNRFQGWDFCAWGVDFVEAGHHHMGERSAQTCPGGRKIMHFINGLAGHSRQPGEGELAGRAWFYMGAQGIGVYRFSATPTELRWKFVTTTGAVLDVGSMVAGKQPPPPDVEICSDGTPLPPGEEVCPAEEAPPPPPPVVETLTKPIAMTAGQVIENRSFTYSGGGSQAIMFQIEPGDDNVTIRNIQTLGGYEVIRAGGGAITGINIDGLRSTGVKRSCFWGRGTDVRNVVIRNVDCSGDPAFLPTSLGDLREGLALHTSYDGVLIENSRFSGFKMAMTGYNNGDGVASEREAKNVKLRRVVATDNTDGGFDLKTEGVILDDLYAARNFRNFRLWGDTRATRLSCGDFTGACIWANGRSGLDPTKPVQTLTIDLLVVRAGPGSKGAILQGTNTVKPIYIIKACDIQAVAGVVISQGISAKSVLGPGCNVVKPFTGPLVIPDVVQSPAVIGERG